MINVVSDVSAGKIGGGCSGTSGQKGSCSDNDALCMTTGQVMTCSESLSVCFLSIIFVFLLFSCVCTSVCLSVPFCLFSHFCMCLQSHPASPSHLSVSHSSGPLPVYVSVTLTSVPAVGLPPLLFPCPPVLLPGYLSEPHPTPTRTCASLSVSTLAYPAVSLSPLYVSLSLCLSVLLSLHPAAPQYVCIPAV